MKKIILSLAMISTLGLIADDHLPDNFSKYLLHNSDFLLLVNSYVHQMLRDMR